MYVWLDIETIPGQASWIREYLLAGLKPPGNISKQETIDKWWAEKSHDALDQAAFSCS